jgi:poly-D-alanine transfer protein DltD
MVQKSPQKVLVGKLHTIYGNCGFVATPLSGVWCEVSRYNKAKYLNVQTGDETETKPKGFKKHKEISGWSPDDYLSDDDPSSDDYDLI